MNTIDPSMSTASSALPDATLPAPSIGTALDGGLGYNDLVDRNGYTYVEVGPIPKANRGDTVTVFWAGSAVALYSMEDTDLGRTFPIPVSNGKIADAGDGDKVVSYTVTYNQGGGEDPSTPALFTVKRSVPGGLDPYPGTPDVNENLVKATVSPDPVPPETPSVTISAPLWINPAQGDQMVVSWNGAMFFAPLLASAPFPDTVSVTLTTVEVLDAGVGPAVPVTWGVHDKVANWSGWAAPIEVEVRLEDPGLFLAPRVGDKDLPWTRIDLAALGKDDLVVFTPDYAGAAAGDSVIVHAHGTALDGEKVEFDSVPQTMGPPGFGLTFYVSNATALALAGGNARVWYSVTGKDNSHSVWLPVVGAAQGDFPVPVVDEAQDTDNDGVDDWLDPDTANPAHITIDYPTMARDDLVTLIMEGTGADGAPVKIKILKQIGTPAALRVTVPQVDILTFLGSQMDVYYLVSPYSRRRAFTRALRDSKSGHLALQVRRQDSEEPLPAPSVTDDNGNAIAGGGYVDSFASYVEAIAGYPNIAKGDEITYSWVGTVSTRKETYRVRDEAAPPTDRVDRDFIVANDGGSVIASYSVKRVGPGRPAPSEVVEFRIAPALLMEDFENVPVGRLDFNTPLPSMTIETTSNEAAISTWAGDDQEMVSGHALQYPSSTDSKIIFDLAQAASRVRFGWAIFSGYYFDYEMVAVAKDGTVVDRFHHTGTFQWVELNARDGMLIKQVYGIFKGLAGTALYFDNFAFYP